jgi:glutathione peroxidase-family protein
MIFSFFLILSLSKVVGQGFYGFSYTALNGSTVSTSAYGGKRVIVFAFAGGHPDTSMLLYMDSVYVQHQDSIAVIAFPALDLDSTVTTGGLTNLWASMHLHMNVAQPVAVQKGSGTNQIPLFQWLTTMDQNTHFGRDVEGDGQLFVISKKGSLYGVIIKNGSRLVLSGVIGMNTNQ